MDITGARSRVPRLGRWGKWVPKVTNGGARQAYSFTLGDDRRRE
jgi:hypothetical protein